MDKFCPNTNHHRQQKKISKSYYVFFCIENNYQKNVIPSLQQNKAFAWQIGGMCLLKINFQNKELFKCWDSWLATWEELNKPESI